MRLVLVATSCLVVQGCQQGTFCGNRYGCEPLTVSNNQVEYTSGIDLNGNSVKIPTTNMSALRPYVAPGSLARADPIHIPDAASIASLYLTTIILIAQRHDDDLATRRDQLTLELAILSEQKSAKIISMLEEMRRREFGQAHSQDGHAEALAQSAHPQAVLDALQAAHGARDEAGSAD